jgi:hypothetical protein
VTNSPQLPYRRCLREPIPELFQAARFLDEAVSAHLANDRAGAAELIRKADMEVISEWSESLWGKGGPWSRPMKLENAPPYVPNELRAKPRMPGKAVLAALIERDGRHCRFCGIPVIRTEVIGLIRKGYPEAARWGPRNRDQHFGLQALMLHYDHILPHARGGTSDFSNMLITCAPCNCGRSNLTLDEVGVGNPFQRDPVRSDWDGLERFRLLG